MKEIFRRVAHHTSYLMGTPASFVIALVAVFIWAVTGPLFNFSNTWQLVINTATTILTFLMVFLIQNTQNRDAQAMQLKLDEIIRALEPASDDFIDIEEDDDAKLDKLQKELKDFRNQQSAIKEAAANDTKA